MGVAALFMPGLMGIVADRWLNAERLYGVLHLIGAGLLLWASTVRDFETLYVIMLLNAMVYMPTIALNNAVSYKVLEQGGLERHPEIPADPRLGHGRLHRRDVDGGPGRLELRSALQLYISAGARRVPRPVRLHDAGVPAGARSREEEPRGRARARCLRAVPAPADAGVLHLRDDAGRGAADHERLRRRLPRGFQHATRARSASSIRTC